jgi:hypothetical protein
VYVNPDSRTVSATVHCVETPRPLYRVNGVKLVGIQGNRIVNDVRVDAK